MTRSGETREAAQDPRASPGRLRSATEKKRELSSRLEQPPVRELLAAAEKVYSRLLDKHGLAPAAAVVENRGVAPTAQSSTN